MIEPSRRRLSETGDDSTEMVAVDAATAALLDAAALVVGTPNQPRSLGAEVMVWSTIESLGEWSRISLPGTVLAAELFLVNHGGDTALGIDYAAPPPRGCAEAECAPTTADASQASPPVLAPLHLSNPSR